MKRLFDLIGMTIGGWLGWFIGAPISIFTAFIISIIGTGVGIYVTRKVTRQMFP